MKRYMAPIGRSASLGEPPSYIVERYKTILESIDAGIAAMKPGVTCAEVYEAFSAPVVKAGYEVPIKAGYSVGTTFPPRRGEYAGLNLLPNNHTVLQPGMVIHTPRTIRVPGEQTAILAETTLITENGHRVLTHAPRELLRVEE